MIVQEFRGKTYRRYRNEKYLSKGKSRMHRIVWEFYEGRIPEGYHIDHIDNDPLNNDISNLQMLTPKEHAKKHWTKEKAQQSREQLASVNHLAAAWHKSIMGRLYHKSKGMNGGGFKPIIKNCSHCHNPFIAKSWQHRYCHQNCKMKARRIRLKTDG